MGGLCTARSKEAGLQSKGEDQEGATELSAPEATGVLG